MRHRCLRVLLAALLVTGGAFAQREAGQHSDALIERSEELNLAVGETKSLSAVDVKSFSEGIRGIADVRLTPDSSQFIVVGQKSGATTLLLIKKDGTQLTYNINVFSRSPASVERELSQLLDGTPGVRMRRVGARFFIEGGVSNEPALKRIEQIAALFPGQVESLVVLGGAAAERRLNLRIDFMFVQFDRSKGYQVGVSWPGRIGGDRRFTLGGEFDFLSGVVGAARATVVDQPLPALDLAATKGWAKVLKYSTVVTANGTEANFSSGGEQNYVISSGFGAALTQVRFGTDVKVLPRFDPATRELEVQLAAEVMDLTPPVAAGTDLPGRNVSKLSTLVSLKLGQSIVLSGIRTRSQRHSVSGLPLLSEIPILGVFFGSHGDSQEEVEGAIYVVPSIIEAVPKSAQEIVDEALREYK
ncbi:MAG TPA: pilus assembly protein N-terminal domain-containing protein, partial [Polyangiaceae bacterium]|nr:pilus assembly protein N-terminal domain-containing protein [Polyangiaceae bacterium]